MSPLVELRKVTKTFPGVKALDEVSLTVHSGECLALVGENGAGKSTLMKILSGTYPAGSFSGEILTRGIKSYFHSPLEAERAGIAIIHQELSGFPQLSIAENLFVGHWSKKLPGLVNWKKINEDARLWLDRVGCKVDPNQKMSSLAVGQQQMVEIAKALSRQSKVLILDEPTSALTPTEVHTLFSLIRDLRKQGVGLVYISHKMEEIYELADRITVLRDGKSVHTALSSELNEEKLITHMVGRSLTGLYPQRPDSIREEEILQVREFSGKNENGRNLFGPLNFKIRKGEILGIAGLLGSGRSETLRAIFGDPTLHTTGDIIIKGKSLKLKSPRAALRAGIALVAEDRKNDSILPKRSLEENASIARLGSGNLARILNTRKERDFAIASLKRLSTKATGPEQEIQQLSGGNQQKVILARALETAPEVILLDEPTRGVDVGAKYEIYEILFRLAAEGKALLVVSSDLPELMALADRIIILNSGKASGEIPKSLFSQETIMAMAIKGS